MELPEKNEPQNKLSTLGVAASSVLMGDTSMFTPQAGYLPPVKAKFQNDTITDSV